MQLPLIRPGYWALTALLAVVLVPAQAQSLPAIGGNAATSNLETLSMGAPALSYDTRLEKTRGNPYAFNQWLTGEIIPGNPRIRPLQAKLKYDVFHQQLLVWKGGRDSSLINPALVQSFILTDILPGVTHRFVRFANSPVPAYQSEFVEVLTEQPTGYALYKRYSKEFVQASYRGAYSSDRPYDELVHRAAYYLRRPDGTAVEVKLSRKALAAAAPALTALAQQKGTIKTERDAVAALQAAGSSK